MSNPVFPPMPTVLQNVGGDLRKADSSAKVSEAIIARLKAIENLQVAVVKMLRQKVRQKTSYRGKLGDNMTVNERNLLDAAVAAGWLEDPRAQK